MLAASCVHSGVREFLPESGAYTLNVLDPDGTPRVAEQRVLIVREPGTAAVLFLSGDAGDVPPLCLANASPKTCDEVLRGQMMARAYQQTPEGVVSVGDVLVLPAELKAGKSWVVVEAGGCQLVREVAAVDRDTVVVSAVSRCPGIPDEKKFIERWRRGVGPEELVTSDGHKMVITRATAH